MLKIKAQKEQSKPKESTHKEIMKFYLLLFTFIIEEETRKTKYLIKKSKSCVFKKINKTLVNLIKDKEESTYNKKKKNEKGEITIETQGILKNHKTLLCRPLCK